MNRAQRVVGICGLGLAVTVALVPPWRWQAKWKLTWTFSRLVARDNGLAPPRIPRSRSSVLAEKFTASEMARLRTPEERRAFLQQREQQRASAAAGFEAAIAEGWRPESELEMIEGVGYGRGFLFTGPFRPGAKVPATKPRTLAAWNVMSVWRLSGEHVTLISYEVIAHRMLIEVAVCLFPTLILVMLVRSPKLV